MLKLAFGSVLFCTIFSVSALAETCPRGALAEMGNRIDGDGVSVGYRTQPARIAVGKPFRIEVVACTGGDKYTVPSRIRVDAGMPMHGHGMNYRPSERKLAPGHSTFDGMVFHMPGDWQLTFDVYDGETRKRLTRKVRVTR